MAKLIISLNGVNLRDYELDTNRITLGRNSSNDIILNEPVVSGEHAAIQLEGGAAVTDLGSTNGTYVNGRLINKQPLQHNDVIAVGSHELRFIDESVQDFAATVVLQQESESAAARAALKILNGPRSGEVMPITRQRTALGKPGVQVAVIMQQGNAYQLQPVALSGKAISTRLNGRPLGEAAEALKEGDVIEIADVRLEFVSQ
ncbi:MAG: FHA domain-containing protein [Pseudomonadota bacterium]